MSFTIHYEHHNGYRCTCCREHWEQEPLKLDTKDAALAKVTPEIPEEHPDFGVGLWNIRVMDEDGNEIAAGQMEWPPVVSRGTGYLYTRWHGHIEGEPFDTIRHDRPYNNTGGGTYEGYPRIITDKTWEQIVDEVTSRGVGSPRKRV